MLPDPSPTEIPDTSKFVDDAVVGPNAIEEFQGVNRLAACSARDRRPLCFQDGGHLAAEAVPTRWPKVRV
jgi:hypothetical protein